MDQNLYYDSQKTLVNGELNPNIPTGFYWAGLAMLGLSLQKGEHHSLECGRPVSPTSISLDGVSIIYLIY